MTDSLEIVRYVREFEKLGESKLLEPNVVSTCDLFLVVSKRGFVSPWKVSKVNGRKLELNNGKYFIKRKSKLNPKFVEPWINSEDNDRDLEDRDCELYKDKNLKEEYIPKLNQNFRSREYKIGQGNGVLLKRTHYSGFTPYVEQEFFIREKNESGFVSGLVKSAVDNGIIDIEKGIDAFYKSYEPSESSGGIDEIELWSAMMAR